jgi:hypothetical protein
LIYKNKIGIKIEILIFKKIFPKLDSQFGPFKVRVHMECLAPKSISRHYFE